MRFMTKPAEVSQPLESKVFYQFAQSSVTSTHFYV